MAILEKIDSFLRNAAATLSEWLEEEAARLADIEQAEARIMALSPTKKQGKRLIRLCDATTEGIVPMSHVVEKALAAGIHFDAVNACVARWDSVGRLALKLEMDRRAVECRSK